MRGLFTNDALTIEPGQAVSGIASRPQTFRVVEGDVWVTVEGFSHDYWLSAGDTFTAQPGRLVVVESGHQPGRIVARKSTSFRLLRELLAYVAARTGKPRTWRAAPAVIRGQHACCECC